MNFGHARTLANAGLFSEALVVLRDCSIPREDRLSAEVLRTELLERTGKYTEAGERADALLKSRNITETHRSGCYLTLGRIAAEGGRFDDAVAHLQRARTIALL